jgi:hypothetical protein
MNKKVKMMYDVLPIHGIFKNSIYTVVDQNYHFYCIINDFDEKKWLSKSYFKDIRLEIRSKKLKRIFNI